MAASLDPGLTVVVVTVLWHKYQFWDKFHTLLRQLQAGNSSVRVLPKYQNGASFGALELVQVVSKPFLLGVSGENCSNLGCYQKKFNEEFPKNQQSSIEYFLLMPQTPL